MNKKEKEVKYDGERWHKLQYEPLIPVQVKVQQIFETLQLKTLAMGPARKNGRLVLGRIRRRQSGGLSQ